MSLFLFPNTEALQYPIRQIGTYGASAGDPLEALNFSIRLQSASSPFDLFQDEACTIPVDEEFQQIAGMKDARFGTLVTFEQSDPNKQPLAVIFEGKWVPVFDGVDDELRSTYVMPDSDMTLFSVWHRYGEGSYPVLLGSYDGASNNNRAIYIDSPGVDNFAWGNSPDGVVPTYDFSHDVTWAGMGTMGSDYSVELYSGGILGSGSPVHNTSNQVCTFGLGHEGYLLATMVMEHEATLEERELLFNFAVSEYGASLMEP